MCSEIQRWYLKNLWTNTRLVCTHEIAFYVLCPNIIMQVKVNKEFKKKKSLQIYPVIYTQHPQGDINLMTVITHVEAPLQTTTAKDVN